MDKIRELLEACGISPENSSKIIDSLEQYRTTLREQLETDFSAKTEQAKKLCIEETEAYKRELARRMQIFCEARGVSLMESLSKQLAIRDSEATVALQKIAEILGEGGATGGVAGRSQAEVERLKRHATKLTEERERAVEAANRSAAVAEAALKRQRQMETEIQRLKGRGTDPQRQVQESRQTGTNGRPNGRIDGTRQRVRPTSTRPTLVESQDPRPVQPRPASQQAAPLTEEFSIDSVAAGMEADLI